MLWVVNPWTSLRNVWCDLQNIWQLVKDGQIGERRASQIWTPGCPSFQKAEQIFSDKSHQDRGKGCKKNFLVARSGCSLPANTGDMSLIWSGKDPTCLEQAEPVCPPSTSACSRAHAPLRWSPSRRYSYWSPCSWACALQQEAAAKGSRCNREASCKKKPAHCS